MDGGRAVDPYNVLKGIGNLCIRAAGDPRYRADTLVRLLLSGVLAPATAGSAPARRS